MTAFQTAVNPPKTNTFLLKKAALSGSPYIYLSSECSEQREPFLHYWTDFGMNSYLAAQELVCHFVILQVPEDNQAPAVSN